MHKNTPSAVRLTFFEASTEQTDEEFQHPSTLIVLESDGIVWQPDRFENGVLPGHIRQITDIATLQQASAALLAITYNLRFRREYFPAERGNIPARISRCNGKFAHDMGTPLRLSSKQIIVVAT
jgi:hypothetical protein